MRMWPQQRPATAVPRPETALVGALPIAGRHVVLGVGGGIAAYKSVELLRRLTSSGAEVECVLTEAACRFVGPLTFTALSGRAALTELFGSGDPIPHTRLGRWADLIVVAPATADLIARLAVGLADDLLTNTVLATRAPVLVAAAMHTEMWDRPSTRRNVARLREDGVTVIDPDVGRLAGGDVGPGRMAEPVTIASTCADLLNRDSSLAGVSVLVTAGGTREPVDPVRYVGNRSSGRMGHAVAAAAASRGARVTLVTTSSLSSGPGIDRVDVETAAEMADAVLSRYDDVDVVVMSAAVADFRPAAPANAKLKKESGPPRIVLEPTLDILAEMGRRKQHQVLVGFAAETDDVAAHGSAKARAKNLDLLVANLVGVDDSGFGTDTNRAYLCLPGDQVEDLGLLGKDELAGLICDRVGVALADSR